MPAPESEFFLGANKESRMNKENPDVSPMSEEIPYSEIPEGGEEKVIFHSETPKPQEILSTPELRQEQEQQIEIQSSRERKSSLEQPKKEPLRALFLKKIMEKWRKREITEEEKKKSLIALKQLWPVHGVICVAGAVAIGLRFGPDLLRTRSFISLLWRMRSDPLFAAYSLMPGVGKLGAIFAYEKRYGIKFSIGSKLLSLWPFLGGGSAMPIEIAYTLGEGPWLVNEIKERYFKTPLTRVRSVARKVRSVFKE